MQRCLCCGLCNDREIQRERDTQREYIRVTKENMTEIQIEAVVDRDKEMSHNRETDIDCEIERQIDRTKNQLKRTIIASISLLAALSA